MHYNGILKHSQLMITDFVSVFLGKKLMSPYPVSNHEVGYLLSGPWGRVISAAQERSWSDALPDTTNDPDRFRTHDPLTMSCSLSISGNYSQNYVLEML